MKKLLLLPLLVLFFMSCGDDPETELPIAGKELVFNPFTNFTPSIISAGGKEIIIFTAKSSWKATVNDEAKTWCSVSSASGEKGYITLTITVKKNKTIVDREALVVIESGESTQNIELTQERTLVFSDLNFKAYILNRFDANLDGEISNNEALSVRRISCSELEITSLDGIEYFTNLETLVCDGNQLTTLDVSECTMLTSLFCGGNQLTTLDVSECTALDFLDCYGNQLTTLDVSECTALYFLNCSDNQLTTLDVSECTALYNFSCSGNQLTTLDVSECIALYNFSCYGNQLTTLDVSECTALYNFSCYGNQLTTLDMSACTMLTSLNCSGNQLTTLDVSGCTALDSLDCSGNQLTFLNLGDVDVQNIDLSKALKTSESFKLISSKVISLDCSDNQLTALDVSECIMLTSLFCKENPIQTLYLKRGWHGYISKPPYGIEIIYY